MEYRALYRKYRSNSFEDFVDQDNIKRILINSILENKISHAYLFSGPRGIGKTSMAKIFAKAINCLNFTEKHDVCNECDNCNEANNNSVDIIEIDAASNNGVDQIRDLKNKISIVPSKLKYKVYIVDEVHMLSNSAFNALLKTLEEPPAHVVFILATTEFYQVPETIVSRCQCFNFNRISQKNLESRLRYIANKEMIDIDDSAISEIAAFSNGGLRDAIGMLDKLRSFTEDKITVDVFKNINGMVSLIEIEQFYNDIFNNNVLSVLTTIDKLNNQGYDFRNFIERLMCFTRDKIVNYYVCNANISGNINDNIELVSVLNEILNKLKEAVNPIIIMQIYLLKYLDKTKNISREIKMDEKLPNKIEKKPIINSEQKEEKSKKNNVSEKVNKIVVNENIKQIRINNAMATANINYKRELSTIWQNINRYFMDEKYGKVSQLLSDTEIMVVGSENVILISSSEGLINNIYSNLRVVEEFFDTIYRKLKVIVVKKEEFEKIKNKYIEDKKKNIVYEVMEEYDKLIEEHDNLVNQAINVFGSDVVEIE